MNNTPTAPAEKPANLLSLHRELAELAACSKPADRPPQGRSQQLCGPVIVIRGK
jgi:hypothetical protein